MGEDMRFVRDSDIEPAFGMEERSDRLTMLPQYSKEKGLVAPQFIYDALRAMSAPGRALQGQAVAPEEGLNTALEVVGGGYLPGALRKPVAGVVSSSGASPGQISTRYPTAVKATEDPLGHDLLIDRETVMQDPKSVAKIGTLLEGYPNIKPDTPENMVQQLIEHEQKNLDFIHEQMPPELRQRAKLWYDGANKIANEQATNYKTTPEVTSAVYASMSPQKDWFMNVALGDRVMDINTNQLDTVFDKGMGQTLTRISGKLKSAPARLAMKNVVGKRLGDLEDPVDRALWIRLFDETHNSREYNIITPEGGRGGLVMTDKDEPAKVAWGSLNEIKSAVSSMADPSLANISREMGVQHKVRNFYNNIFAPNSPRGEGTIDTHAIAAALMRPLAGKDAEVLQNFGSGVKKSLLDEDTGGRVPNPEFEPWMAGPPNSSITGAKGTYGLHLDALQKAAALRGHLPREMQSITWEGVRGLFSNKSDKQKALANTIWNDYKAGKITQEHAQQLVLEAAGGMDAPAWANTP